MLTLYTHTQRARFVDWNKAAEGNEDDERLWEDNWDDDEADDGFADQLRKELEKSGTMTD